MVVRGEVLFTNLSVNLNTRTRQIGGKKAEVRAACLFPFCSWFRAPWGPPSVPPRLAEKVSLDSENVTNFLLLHHMLMQTHRHTPTPATRESKLAWMWAAGCCPHSKQRRDSAPLLPVHPTCSSKEGDEFAGSSQRVLFERQRVWRFTHRLHYVPVWGPSLTEPQFKPAEWGHAHFHRCQSALLTLLCLRLHPSV